MAEEQVLMVTIEKGQNGAPDETIYDLIYQDEQSPGKIMLDLLKKRYLEDLKREAGGRHVSDLLVEAGYEKPVNRTRWNNLLLEEIVTLTKHLLGFEVTITQANVHGFDNIEEALMDLDATNLPEAAEQFDTLVNMILDCVPGSRIGTDGPFSKAMRALAEIKEAHNRTNVPTTATSEARQPNLFPYGGITAKVKEHSRS